MNVLQSLNDTEIWLLVRNGDREAFEQLYRRHFRPLYAAIYKWVDNKADAEDILQEVFLDLWEKRSTIEIRQQVFRYLYSITRFKVFDYIKAKGLTTRQLAAWDQVMASGGQVNPEEDDHGLLLDAAIAGLAPQMKRVYLLRYREERSIQEIADTLLVSPSTIKNHLQQIRKRLYSISSRLTSLLVSLLFILMSL